MTARGAGILSGVSFVLLLAIGSYLLDVPTPTVLVGATFAILVILWIGTRDASGAARSFSAGDAPAPATEQGAAPAPQTDRSDAPPEG